MRHHLDRVLTSAALAAALSIVLVGGASAAAPGRVTSGDVRALFETRTTANQVQLAKNLSVSAARTAFIRGRINPFASNQAFCDRDWLILLVSFGGDQTHRSTQAIRAGTSVSFLVDGTPVSTMSTATKRFLTGDPKTAFFGWSVGHFYAPGSLADGTHALETTLTFPTGTEVIDTTFDVGAAACA
jgi:hypothetical protein